MLRFTRVAAIAASTFLISPATAQTSGGESASSGGAAANTQPQYMIEEVFVTTSKRVESVQDVSAAVSAFNDETLKANNINSFDQLADVTPGVISRDQSEGNNLTIRGVGKAFGGTSPVAFHVNGFFVDTTEAFYDVSSLEVIRGPSGTVYGRNATAGAINVKWQRPVEEWEAGADYLRGSFDHNRLRAFANVPLVSWSGGSVNARVAGFWEDRNGYIDNEFADSDEEPLSGERYFYRIMLEGFVTENLRLGVHAIKNRSENRAGLVASPSLSTRASERYEEFGVERLPDDLLIVRSQQFEEQGPTNDKNSRVVFDMTWSMPELPLLGNVDFDFQIGAHRHRTFRYTDLDGSEVKIVETISDLWGVGRASEARFTSQNGNGIDWILGFFWFRDDHHDTLHVDARTKQNVGQLFFSPLPIPSETDQVFDASIDYIDQNRNEKNEAIFLNVRYSMQEMFASLPDVELFGGFRKNTDNFRLKTQRELLSATCATELPGNPCGAGSFPVSDTNTDVGGEWDANTGEAGAKWFYSDTGMVYAKYATGYKPGTAQLRTDGTVNDVDPEYLNMIETGWKTTLFDNRSLVLNVSAFDYTYEDLQVSKIVVNGIELNNAGAASIRGVEAELQWAPSAQLFALFSFGWLDAKFEEFCGRDDELVDQAAQSGCTDAEPHNFEGAKMTDSPEFTVGMLLRYTFNLDDWGTLTPAVKFSWSDDYQRRPYDNPIDEVPAHHKTDIRLSWQSPQQRYRVEAFVENLEDHDEIFTHHFSQPDPGNYSLISPQPPRTAGFSMEVAL